MSSIRSRIALISLVLLTAFMGQMAVHTAEQAGWFCCGTAVECQQDSTESPGDSHASFGGCCQHVLALPTGPREISALASSEIQYPPFSSLRPDGPVFEIEIPPQVG